MDLEEWNRYRERVRDENPRPPRSPSHLHQEVLSWARTYDPPPVRDTEYDELITSLPPRHRRTAAEDARSKELLERTVERFTSAWDELIHSEPGWETDELYNPDKSK